MIQVVDLNNGHWAIKTSSYSVTVHEQSKATPGMHWHNNKKGEAYWWGRADAVEAAVARCRARGCRIIGNVAASATHSLRTESEWNEVASHANLRAYQVEGWRFLLEHADSGALLADDLGLGKTIQALFTAATINGRTIIVCPKFVRNEWTIGITGGNRGVRTIPAAWPACKFVLLEGTKPSPIAADVKAVIINYDILKAWADTLIEWKPETLVIDEAHYLVDDKSKRSQAVRKVAEHCKNRIACSATPKPNRLIDLWNVLDILDPGRFGKRFNFGLTYCNGHQKEITPDRVVWEFSGASNEEELATRLRHLMIRRTRSDVAMQLPARDRQILELNVAKQFVIAPTAAMRSDRDLHQALCMAADGKIPYVIESIAADVAHGHKVVCWTHRRAVAEQIAHALVAMGISDVAVSHGEVDADKRAEILKREPTVTCATIDAHQAGIDMTYADVGTYAELIYEPHKLLQTEGRQHRFGQTRPVIFRYCVALGTIDEVIRDVCLRKLKVDSDVIGRGDHALDDTFNASKAGSGAAALKALYDRMMAATEDDFDGRSLELAAAVSRINNAPDDD